MEEQQAAEQIFHEIQTEEQALQYIRELVGHVLIARNEADEAMLIDAKRAAFQNLMIRYGRALGAVTTLMHCRKISPVAYNELVGEIHGSLVPSITEVAPTLVTARGPNAGGH